MAQKSSFSDKDKIIGLSIATHLQAQVDSEKLGEEQSEGLAVAIQCICEAYGVDLEQKDKYGINQTLEELFPDVNSLSEADRAKADEFKQKGNAQLKLNRIEAAIELYSQAIEVDSNNATFYCNRAAAYIKIEKYQEALRDCEKAVEIDPEYGRAHGRLGYIHSVQGRYAEAKECFLKAIQIDPNNDSYKGNLDAVEEQLKAPPQGGAPGPGGGLPAGGLPGAGLSGLGGMLGGAGMAGLFQNPGFMNMATQMMQNPAFQTMAGRMMQQGGPNPESMAEMMPEMVQTARQMQQENPDLFENLQQTASQFSSQNNPQPEDKSKDEGPPKE